MKLGHWCKDQNRRVLVGAFNQEKALVGAFSVIVQLRRLIDLRHYTAHCTSPHSLPGQLIFTRGIQLDPSQQIKLNNCLKHSFMGH